MFLKFSCIILRFPFLLLRGVRENEFNFIVASLNSYLAFTVFLPFFASLIPFFRFTFAMKRKQIKWVELLVKKITKGSQWAHGF